MIKKPYFDSYLKGVNQDMLQLKANTNTISYRKQLLESPHIVCSNQIKAQVAIEEKNMIVLIKS